MARYIKANPKVAQFLRVENDRNQVKDGNYLLWQADMLAFGTLAELPLILQKIGGISLMAHEARQEQDGTVVRELPTATDPRFVVDTQQPTDGEAENEKSGETAEAPAEPAGEETENKPLTRKQHERSKHK